jgi:hypothetical protein
MQLTSASSGMSFRVVANDSLANPWLDFLPSSFDTLDLTKSLNDDLQSMCFQHPQSLYAFGVLPSAANPVSAWIQTLHHISKLSHIKGVILGTKGLGKGLDDPKMDPIWSQLEKYKLMTFIHPHYGINKDVYGDRENGHVLPLTLGFPFETTIVYRHDFINLGHFATYISWDIGQVSRPASFTRAFRWNHSVPGRTTRFLCRS